MTKPASHSQDEWYSENITPDLLQVRRLNGIMHSGVTAHQSITIHNSASFGLSLILDNKTQSTELDEFIYHESLVHPAMLSHTKPQDILVIGGGEGATIREVLIHNTVQHVTMVDIDSEVVKLCQTHLTSFHKNSFNDERLRLEHVDALEYLSINDNQYDVVIIDAPDPLEGGPAVQLYTQEFYGLVISRLKEDGVTVTQAGSTGPTFNEQSFPLVANTISSVFPKTAAYETFIPSYCSTWGFVVGSMHNELSSLSTATIDDLLTKRVNRDLLHYDGTTHAGMFAIPKYLRRAMKEEQRVVSKRSPLIVP